VQGLLRSFSALGFFIHCTVYVYNSIMSRGTRLTRPLATPARRNFPPSPRTSTLTCPELGSFFPSISTAVKHGPPDASASSATMAEPKPLMYAELLANIRQISVIAALETPCDSSTRVELSADGHQFTLHHEGKTTVLNLPGTTSPNIQLQKPALGAKELSWRLPLVSEPTASSAESSDAPWPAKDLDEDSEFRCRSCAEVVVGKGKVTVWKDLPSENWADMMDFWHCHKPSTPANGDHSHEEASSRGYGANTKFTAQPTVGFVDLTTLLLAESDCRGIEVRYFLLSQSLFHSGPRA